MKKSVFYVLFSAFFVAACGDNSASMGVGGGADVSSKSSESLTKSKTISAEKNESLPIKIPAQMTITDALFRKNLSVIGSRARARGFSNIGIKGVDFQAVMAETIKSEYDENPAKWAEENKDLEPNLFELVTSNGSLEDITYYYRRGDYLMHLAACVSPAQGWEVDPIPGGKKPLEYMRYIATACEFTSEIFSLIITEMGGKFAEDPEDAKKKIAKTFYKIPLGLLESAWNSAVKANRGRAYLANLTNVPGVQFTGPNAYYRNENGGFIVSRGGVILFGGGMINGKNVELSVFSSVVKRTE